MKYTRNILLNEFILSVKVSDASGHGLLLQHHFTGTNCMRIISSANGYTQKELVKVAST